MDSQLASGGFIDQLAGLLRLAVACFCVAASARRLAPWLGDARVAPRILTEGIVATWLVTMGVVFLATAGSLSGNGLISLSVLLFLGTRMLPTANRAGVDRSSRIRPHTAPALILAAPIVIWDLGWRLPAPPTSWDALTYHLYLPARWLLEGQIAHVPTVFGDPAAAFAPQNAALLFAWWLGLLGGDVITNVVNFLAAILFTVALVRLARRCGAPREAAGLAAVGTFWITPMRNVIYESNVDMVMLAFWAASLVFTLQALDRSRAAPWLGAGLSTGLAVGTKVIGLVLLGPQALLFAVILCVRRLPRALAGFILAGVAGGGWWFLNNLVRFGNPLFPLDLKLGPWSLFPGPIPYQAMAGQFYIPVDRLPEFLFVQFGAVGCLLVLVGTLALFASAILPGPHRAPRTVVSAIALYWGCYYAFSLPHNNQTRFLLPVVATALVGAAIGLGVVEKRSHWASRLLWAVLLISHFFDVGLIPWWRAFEPSPLAAGISFCLWIPLGLATIASLCVAFSSNRPGLRRLFQASSIFGVLACIGFAQSFSASHRDYYTAHARYNYRLAAVRALERVDPSAMGRVAYTGFNLPYVLMGAHQSRFVRYVNIQGGLEDGSYDFWHEERRQATRQKPAFYRGRGDYDTWLANLETARIEWIVVVQLANAERYIHTDTDGFPIERKWAESQPDRFELSAAGRGFRIFRLTPR